MNYLKELIGSKVEEEYKNILGIIAYKDNEKVYEEYFNDATKDESVCAFSYALSAGVVRLCLVTENKESEIAQKMANVIAVKNGHQEDTKTKVLIEALKQENIKEFIKTKFGESVLYLL